MKLLVREFFRTLQGLLETEMGQAATHILHVKPSAKRCWVHSKIVFSKPKSFNPLCYTMKEWTENMKKKTTVIQKLHKFSSWDEHFCGWWGQRGVLESIQGGIQVYQCIHGGSNQGGGGDFLRSKLVNGGKNRALPNHTAHAFPNL